MTHSSGTRPRVLLGLYHHVPFFRAPAGTAEALAGKFPRFEFRDARDEESLRGELPEAEIYFAWWLTEEFFRSAGRLRWVHTPVVGIRRFLTPSFRASDVLFTNGRGINAVAMAEHVMAALLARTRGILESARVLSGRRWDARAVEEGIGGLRELEGSSLLIVGYGAVGREVAKRALAFGMTVTAIHRRQAEEDAETLSGVRIRPREDLLDALGDADYIVLALPHTEETENLIDEAAFRRMRKSAYLVNVGRGAVIVEPALIRALSEGWIDGASLDVVAHEPLDPASPLHDAPRLALTPHISGITPRYWERATAQFEENLGRFERGEPLRNIVDKRAGY